MDKDKKKGKKDEPSEQDSAGTNLMLDGPPVRGSDEDILSIVAWQTAERNMIEVMPYVTAVVAQVGLGNVLMGLANMIGNLAIQSSADYAKTDSSEPPSVMDRVGYAALGEVLARGAKLMIQCSFGFRFGDVMTVIDEDKGEEVKKHFRIPRFEAVVWEDKGRDDA